jgi:hypothetical protein
LAAWQDDHRLPQSRGLAVLSMWRPPTVLKVTGIGKTQLLDAAPKHLPEARPWKVAGPPPGSPKKSFSTSNTLSPSAIRTKSTLVHDRHGGGHRRPEDAGLDLYKA